MALAYLIAKPAVTSVIVGARTEEQLADNLAAAELALTDEEVARLDAVSAQPLRYPYWHQAKTAARPAEPGRPQPAGAPPGLIARVRRRSPAHPGVVRATRPGIIPGFLRNPCRTRAPYGL